MCELLSLSRLARQLGVTQKWLREQADAGAVPSLKADSRYLFSPNAVRSALAVKAAEMREGKTQ